MDIAVEKTSGAALREGPATAPAPTFESILFPRPDDRPTPPPSNPPDFFVDLNLDQVVKTVVGGREEYNLTPFFLRSLGSVDAVRYRHEVFRDLETAPIFAAIEAFALKMRAVREHREQAEKLYHKYQKLGWFLDAVEIYCEAVANLANDLDAGDGPKSRGLRAFRAYLGQYARSAAFRQLVAETRERKADLATVRYSLTISGGRVRVRKYADQADYSVEVLATFEKFKQGVAKDYSAKLRASSDMNHIEAGILDRVALLFPAVFSALEAYEAKNAGFLDPTIATFDREIQFYVAYLDRIAALREAGLVFCYPEISATDKEVFADKCFDWALAHKLVSEKAPVVCNDFYLKGVERIFVVSGPNQGGKTTFARTFGQMHFLASLGCPIPGERARMFLFDRLFTHFEREEDIETQRGKLEDELVRVHAILAEATSDSVIIMNEIFTSTTLSDAIFLSKRVLRKIIELDLLCVCVTFIDELASLSEKTVSLVSTVVPENPAERTFKIERRPADGLAYAMSLAEKYGVTYRRLKERLRR